MSNVARNLKIKIDWENPDRFVARPQLTKVVCTLGPATGTGSEDGILGLMRQGMHVARLNMSHGNHEATGVVVKNFRAALDRYREEQAAAFVNLMLDTKGPEIRTGVLKNDSAVLKEGSTVKVTTDMALEGDDTTISLDYADLATSTKVGNLILIADGSLTLRITGINVAENYCECRVMNTCKIGNRKNVHLPGAHVTLPALQQKDIDDLKWGIEVGVDMVAASFVKTADDVRQIRRVLGIAGKHIRIMSKIETTEGLTNIDDIVRESDGIMVARGDLGVECPLEEIFLAQKMIISKCNDAGKPVVTATQMLESMTDNPRPTRAEATDVANAVLDGTDCVMLSGETAMGRFPHESVQYLNKISTQAEMVESKTPSDTLFQSLKLTAKISDIPEVVAMYAVRMQRDLGAKLIVTITETGTTTRLVAKYRPDVPVMAATNREDTAKWLVLTRGAYPLVVEGTTMKGKTDDIKEIAMSAARSRGLCAAGDLVVVLSGVIEGLPGKVNRLTVVTVPHQ